MSEALIDYIDKSIPALFLGPKALDQYLEGKDINTSFFQLLDKATELKGLIKRAQFNENPKEVEVFRRLRKFYYELSSDLDIGDELPLVDIRLIILFAENKSASSKDFLRNYTLMLLSESEYLDDFKKLLFDIKNYLESESVEHWKGKDFTYIIEEVTMKHKEAIELASRVLSELNMGNYTKALLLKDSIWHKSKEHAYFRVLSGDISWFFLSLVSLKRLESDLISLSNNEKMGAWKKGEKAIMRVHEFVTTVSASIRRTRLIMGATKDISI